jgi:putative proteasome-type protease
MMGSGMVFASDSRTNAGVDNVFSFRKMTTFEKPGERTIVIVNSGNLAVTQATINQLEQAIQHNCGPHLMSVATMYEVAELAGAALREVRHRDGPFLLQNNVDSSANFIIGGQIGGESQRLFMVYSEGNFIEATAEAFYFQIGEIKYGKPILDRVIRIDTSLDDAIKCVLVSFDSTMRSNLSVGMPVDLAVYERDALRLDYVCRFHDGDPYMQCLRQSWSEGVRRAFAELPILKRERTGFGSTADALQQQEQQQQ